MTVFPELKYAPDGSVIGATYGMPPSDRYPLGVSVRPSPDNLIGAVASRPLDLDPLKVAMRAAGMGAKTVPAPCRKAPDFLESALSAMKDRAATRDRNEERSMGRCVRAFNALTGHQLSETDGWLFSAVLKIARHYGGDKFNPDDFIDGAAYMALAGESEAARGA